MYFVLYVMIYECTTYSLLRLFFVLLPKQIDNLTFLTSYFNEYLSKIGDDLKKILLERN